MDSDLKPRAGVLAVFRSGEDIRVVVMGLAGIDRVYAHLAWLESALDQARQEPMGQVPSELYRANVVRAVAATLLRALRTGSFNPSDAISGTDLALLVTASASGNSWILELVGKLNPISALESLLKTARDWQVDKHHKSLLNSKLAVEILGLELQHRATELSIIRDTIALLKEAGVSDEEIREVLMISIHNLASPLLVAAQSTQDMRQGRLSDWGAIVDERMAQRKAVWDLSNSWGAVE